MKGKLWILAGAAGAAAGLIRRWEMTAAYDPDTGLIQAGHPGLALLAVLSLAAAVVLAVLCRRGPELPREAWPQAFCTPGNTGLLSLRVCAGFLTLAGGVLSLADFSAVFRELSLRRQYEEGVTLLPALAPLALGLLALAAGACLLWLARGWHQGRPSDFALPTLAPALFACVWLLTAERSRASNPVVEVYLWFFFAIIALVLACYTGAGFSFRNGRPAAARTFCWLAVYFALLTLLGDSHSVQEYLLLAGGALWCAAQGEALSGTAWRQPPPEKAPAAAEAEADDGEDDVDFVL